MYGPFRAHESQVETLCGEKGTVPLLGGVRANWLRYGTTGLWEPVKKAPKRRVDQNDAEDRVSIIPFEASNPTVPEVSLPLDLSMV